MPAWRARIRSLAVLLVGVALILGMVPAPAGADAPYSVTLAASATSLPVGASVTLTATANQDVGPTPYYITIFNSHNVLLKSCSSGATCTTSASTQIAGSDTFTAYISGSTGAAGYQAMSNSVTVTWGGSTTTTTRPTTTTTRPTTTTTRPTTTTRATTYSVTLSASSASVPVGTAVTLTARANRDVGPTPLYILIYDNGVQRASCGSGTSCTYSARQSQAGTRTYTARVANSGGIGSQASSSPVNVTWTAAGATTTTTTTTPPATDDSGWSATALRHRDARGSRFSYTCPAGGSARTVWGTSIYSDDSSVCTAAVHAGFITLAQGGTTVIEIFVGQSSYQGSTAYGITTLSWGSWAGSFVVVR